MTTIPDQPPPADPAHVPPRLHFLHITDTHLGPTADYCYNDHFRPAETLRQLVATINAMPHAPDFVLHTGDLTNDPSADAYRVAADLLGALRVPIYFVNGNHDDRALLRAAFPAAGARPAVPGTGDAPLDYVFERAGERFIVLDSFHPEQTPPPGGFLHAAQLDWLRAELAAAPAGVTVAVHHIPFPLHSPWLDQHMVISNGAALHAALLPHRDRLRAVLFGHLHRPLVLTRDGITYIGAGSAVMQYTWWRWHEGGRPQRDAHHAPAYNSIEYFEGQVVVQQHAFARS